jgi:protein-S-isoprenylcysteine O-methyltransferase Ste14
MYRKIIIPPPIIDLILLGLAIFLNNRFPFKFIFPPYNLVFGIFTMSIGGIFILLSVILFYMNRTTIIPGFSPSRIITKGTYRISRNPIYLGTVVMFVGLSFLLGTLVVFIVPILNYLILNFYVIPKEEIICEEVLGNEYLRYKEKTRRWI